DVNVTSVNRLVKIEDVHLEQRLGTAERGPRADTRHRIQRLAREPAHARGEDSHHGTLPAPQVDIGGGEPEFFPQVVAVHDFAGHAVRASEQAGGTLQVPVPQRLADRGAAHPLAVDDDARELVYLEIQR